jgi:hypothetical protein
VGDVETQELLWVVYEDEIRHVRHGLHWFRLWKPADVSDLRAHAAALSPPLSLARAKGRVFDDDGRVRAGLDEPYIEALRVFERSLGRPPRVWWFNPNAEREVEAGGLVADPGVAKLVGDLAPLLGLLAHRDDCVVCPRTVTPEFRAYLYRAGVRLPEVVVARRLGEAQTGHQLVEELVVWSASPAVPPQVADWRFRGAAPRWKQSWRRFFSKSWSASRFREWLRSTRDPRLCAEADVGRVCTSLEQVAERVRSRPCLIKSPFSTAGRRRRRALNGALDPATAAWVRDELGRSGELLVEPCLERVVDLSLQFRIGDAGVEFAGISRFWTSPGGRYRGAWVGRWDRSLSPDFRRLFMSQIGGRSLVLRLQEAGLFLCREMAEDGYRGPVGVDAMLYRGTGELLLKPVVELNPRHTMGLVALRLRALLLAQCCGLWALLSRQDIKRAGFDTFIDFAAWAEAELAVEFEGERVSRGVLWTTDPAQAESILTLLIVGRDASDARTQWRRCVRSTEGLGKWFDEPTLLPVGA